MATDAKELERVRRIHAALDCARSKGCPEGATYDQLSHVLTFDGHSYTAAEVCAWPEMKARIVSTFEKYANSRALCLLPGGGIGEILVGYDVCVDPVARGLCMYREQLSDALSPGRALTADGSARVNEEQAEALGARRLTFKQKMEASAARRETQQAASSVKVSRYQGSDLDQERDFEERTFSRPANEAARLRNIAALAAELSKPASPRYPAEGRSERALSVTNGMIRGRE